MDEVQEGKIPTMVRKGVITREVGCSPKVCGMGTTMRKYSGMRSTTQTGVRKATYRCGGSESGDRVGMK